MIMAWENRVRKVLAEVQAAGQLFINPRSKAQDYQAALESVGKGLIDFDGCYFKAKPTGDNLNRRC